MNHKSNEKVFSDIEKSVFRDQIRANDSGFMHRGFLFIFTLLFSLVVVFLVNFLINYSNKIPLNLNNARSNEFIDIPYPKQKIIYDLEILANYPKIDDYSAKSIVLLDMNSNSIVFEKNPDQKSLVASLTKLASTKVIYDNVNLQNITTITEKSAKYEGSSLVLQPGQVFSNRDLLKASVVVSSNQAVYALQNPDQTIRQMNAYIKSLRLKNTNFSNPAGFDDDGNNYSTAKDLIHIAKVFLDNPVLKDYAGMIRSEIQDLNELKYYKIVNTNELLKNGYYQVIAGKTGTTPRAGQNLVLLVEKNNRRYLLIIIGSTERYKDAIKLIERI